MNGAVFLNLNGSAGFFLDAADNLAARANHFANLVNGNVDGLDTRSSIAQLLARRSDLVQHGSQNKCTALFCLRKRTTEDFRGQALSLVIHLKCGNTFFGTAYLEVHVA